VKTAVAHPPGKVTSEASIAWNAASAPSVDGPPTLRLEVSLMKLGICSLCPIVVCAVGCVHKCCWAAVAALPAVLRPTTSPWSPFRVLPGIPPAGLLKDCGGGRPWMLFRVGMFVPIEVSSGSAVVTDCRSVSYVVSPVSIIENSLPTLLCLLGLSKVGTSTRICTQIRVTALTWRPAWVVNSRPRMDGLPD
jgi:hypothetical protein